MRTVRIDATKGTGERLLNISAEEISFTWKTPAPLDLGDLFEYGTFRRMYRVTESAYGSLVGDGFNRITAVPVEPLRSTLVTEVATRRWLVKEIRSLLSTLFPGHEAKPEEVHQWFTLMRSVSNAVVLRFMRDQLEKASLDTALVDKSLKEAEAKVNDISLSLRIVGVDPTTDDARKECAEYFANY